MSSPKRQRREATARGTIARMHLHNFMTYRDAEIVDPGARLNCIFAPNGAGKSSIVCAMCVGLGGPIKITGRGDNIGACVHGNGGTCDEQGKPITSGFVITELVDAHGPGKNMTVRLDFTLQNQETWHLDGAKSSRKAVKQAMEALNIQVDNPLQFLPQDKVGEFSNMTPVEMLKHTEMAIGPEVYAQHLRLIDLDKEIGLVEQRASTEQKGLDDLEATNRALEKDVERFRQLQENKKRLDGLRGKVLWVEADAREEDAKAARAVWDQKKEAASALKAQLKAKQQEAAPMEREKKVLADRLAAAKQGLKKADEERLSYAGAIDKAQSDGEAALTAMGKLEKKRRDLTQARADREKAVEELRQRIEATKEQMAQEHEVSFDQRKATLDAAVRDAHDAVRREEEALRELRQQERGLQRAKADAQEALGAVDDATKRKMATVVRLSRSVAQAAGAVDADAGLRERVLGPMMMSIDVPDARHQRLVEEAIGIKYAMGFLALDDAARDALTGRKLGINVYATHPREFVPCTRPSAAELRRFGVTAWADEAMQVPPEHRDTILSALSDLVSIDKYLLADARAEGQIESLEKFLRERGMDSVTILTPDRRYTLKRSRYGARNAYTTSQKPKNSQGLFANSVDEGQRETLNTALEHAQEQLRAHAEATQQQAEKLSWAKDTKSRAQDELQALVAGQSTLVGMEGRLKGLEQRLESARRDEAAFDVDAQKADKQRLLAAAARKEASLNAKMVAASDQFVRSTNEMYALTLAHTAAVHQQKGAMDAETELSRQYEERKAESDAAKAETKAKLDAHAAKAAEARKAAPQFERDGAGRRSAAADAAWDAMPGSLQELDERIEELEEEVNGSADDGGKTLKAYEARLKDIDAAKQKVSDTRSEIEEKRGRLADLTAEWKPQLEQMVATVNDNFATYFRRFRCVGEVTLADGRKPNPATGEPEGPDDFAQYKILIKVQWRSSETLHVLGEGGRDSGGERSVATMVYLISLQNINPAPFRVVDEINQAMDSSNERHVFECITHACATGGKQYFLISPKLLPDLEYGEETNISFVLNGVHNQPRDAFTFAQYV